MNHHRRLATTILPLFLLLSIILGSSGEADEFDTTIKPFLVQKCMKCHGDEEVNGDVNFKQSTTVEQFLAAPELIVRTIKAIDAGDMPPEEESQLDPETRSKLVAAFKTLLRAATTGGTAKQLPIRRLNRFQYNNSVKDLFGLRRDVFELPEKLMTRHDNYLHSGTGKMPTEVHVASHSLSPAPGLKGVKAFPKDLPATHGFDNQADRLTLSPLLLDAFLRLSVSIVESEDFNEQNVGIWKQFFQTPAADVDMEAEVRNRLKPFLRLAFRGPVSDETLNGYTSYAFQKMAQGLSFTSSMKKVASAVLSSPLFLYRSDVANDHNAPFRLASILSYFLWGSGPDEELLDLAERGELAKPEVLENTVDRMMADAKIERFLDTFPSQWMQLANVLAVAPDPQINRYFSLDQTRPAGLQMVLEPLLLFDAVFLENRPITDLIAPAFSYQSPFLQDWYTTDLQPDPVDATKIAKDNAARAVNLFALQASIDSVQTQWSELDRAKTDPITAGLISVDLSAGQADWENTQATLVADAPVLSPWYRIGPFPADNFDQAHDTSFLNETDVDLTKTYGTLVWQESKDLEDGKVHSLEGESSATYLFRTLRVNSARPIRARLGSDDSFKFWLNGKLIADKKVSRGVAPDQDELQLELAEGENTLLLKVVNGGGGYGFYFKADSVALPSTVIASLQVPATQRTDEQQAILAKHYLSAAPELADVRQQLSERQATLQAELKGLEDQRKRAPQPMSVQQHQAQAQHRFDDELRSKLRSQTFKRVAVADPRYGGVITNAAMLSMTSGPKRTHPVARGVWIVEVIFNNPPPPPPNDVPPLNEDAGDDDLTIREKFAAHRENPSCAGCHVKIDPLGFALENFDITGRWRDRYENGREVDSSGTLLGRHEFHDIVRFKQALVEEKRRFAKAFTAHLLRFALSRELGPADSIVVDTIVERTEKENFKLQSLVREVFLSESF